ncbi:MAG: PEP-CTERM sorting domain-containing protein [Methylacidiphilales bacterium]|nr:PEP-CTERM sorting domain-containing protein [Candidatus Methylacidiphilales bacterium]MDW8349897.1 PEP-CTERM sorting domain-containing protein [Verrucomicrobiae bacterium]
MRQLLLLLLIPFSTNLHAVITFGDPTNNAMPPTNGAPWNYIGQVNGSSAIYLGNSWALTAFHVGPGNLILGGTTYTYTGTSHRLTTLSPNDADMILFQINGDPGLTPLPLNSTPPSPGSQVTMIGFGFDQGSLIQWDAGWVTIPPSTNPVAFQGYPWLPTTSKKWGYGNIVQYFPTPIDAGNGPNWSFNTTFLLSEDYGQGAAHDSGGGVFYYNGTEWELVGMMFAVTAHTGQPVNTSVNGNQTIHATIAAYKPEILSVTNIPEPSTYALLILGAASCLWFSRSKKRLST